MSRFRETAPPAALAALTVALAMPTAAHAYLDPTSGSILLQLVLGGIAGAAVAVKLFWHRIVGLFSRDRSSSDGTED